MAHGGSGHRGLCVIKVAMEEREKGIDSVTIHFPYMAEMTVLEIGMNKKIAIQKAVLVSEKSLVLRQPFVRDICTKLCGNPYSFTVFVSVYKVKTGIYVPVL